MSKVRILVHPPRFSRPGFEEVIPGFLEEGDCLIAGNGWKTGHELVYAYVGDDPTNKTDVSGLYLCEGAVCQFVDRGLRIIRDAASHLPKGSEGQSRLNGLLHFFGSRDQRNGITVRFGVTRGNVPAETVTDHGQTTITFNAHVMHDAFEDHPNGSHPSVEKAAAGVAHEGTVGEIERAGLNDSSPTTYTAIEREAARTQVYVNEGENEPSAYGWKPGMTEAQRNQMINREATWGTAADCQNNGGC